ncbi:hypothetical protein Q8F55_002019 [Vanrija albida]|uniref:TFIID subunit TAF5 NTD2 domain-containing protein n=1 Tax=Vanrija albida TaxID=181172 RepID=A0ABR3Q8W3_9TREE
MVDTTSNGASAGRSIVARYAEGSGSGTSRRGGEVSPDSVTLGARAEQEISLLIADYLAPRYPRLSDALAAEIGPVRDAAVRGEIEGVERAILDGDFPALEPLLASPGLLGPQTQKAFLYMCWRQQFLEFVDNRESQKAFNLLQKRLKPLEHYQPVPYDFYSLAYLCSASTVHDAPGFRDWAGPGPERERLVAMWRELTDAESKSADSTEPATTPPVPRDRLVTLLRQAAAWQIQASGDRSRGQWGVTSLLSDYARPSVPSRLQRLITGHTANVKCVDFVGEASGLGVSGSSDATLHIFSIDDGATHRVLTGHQSRIWDVASTQDGRLLASGSGDGTVRIWSASTGECASVLTAIGGDVYSVRWQPGRENHVVSACYDKILRAWDVETGKLIRTFSGHAQSTLAVAFDSTGKVIASGSKDKHIRLWDAVGGVCVQTMTTHLGEVTSVEFDHEGKYLLAACKDNSNRLWDLRMQRNIYRYTGHQNTSKNVIRAGFASSTLIASGSEDGLVYLWEREGAQAEESMRTSSNASPALSPPLHQTQPQQLSLVSPSPATIQNRAGGGGGGAYNHPPNSAAYYPPRAQSRSTISASGTPAPTTIRPLKSLAGHGPGAVFDVRAQAGLVLSAGEDGSVGVWGDDDE